MSGTLVDTPYCWRFHGTKYQSFSARCLHLANPLELNIEQHPGYVAIFLQQTHTQFTVKSSSLIKICRHIFKCITHIYICICILSLHHSSVSHLQILLENLHNCWRACGTCSSSCSMITESNSSAACSRLAWKLYCQCFLS